MSNTFEPRMRGQDHCTTPGWPPLEHCFIAMFTLKFLHCKSALAMFPERGWRNSNVLKGTGPR